MSGPNEALFRGLLAYQGLELSDARIVAAVQGHRSIADDLQSLRSVSLPFVGDVPEPSSAIGWIERGATA